MLRTAAAWTERAARASNFQNGTTGGPLRLASLVSAVALVLFGAATAQAAGAPGSATAAVDAANEKLRMALDGYFKAEGAGREKARDTARAAVSTLLDFDSLAQGTLGKRWDELKPADRQRYTDALRGAMEASYLARMQSGKNVDVGAVKSTYSGEEKQGDRTVVKSTLKTGKDAAKVDYVLVKGKKGWRAVDVITEGVSLVETYRDQITRLWPKKGLDGVVAAFDKQRKRLEDKMAAGATPAPSGAAN
jgi:phospholipid transport system substrate-binding protein